MSPRKAIGSPAGHGNEAVSGRVTIRPDHSILEIGGVLFDLSTDTPEVVGEYREEVKWSELATFAYDLAMLLEERVRHGEPLGTPGPKQPPPRVVVDTEEPPSPPHFFIYGGNRGGKTSAIWNELYRRWGI